jgi:hypothetical protein
MVTIASLVAASALLSFFPEALAQSSVYGQCELSALQLKTRIAHAHRFNYRWRDWLDGTYHLRLWVSILSNIVDFLDDDIGYQMLQIRLHILQPM